VVMTPLLVTTCGVMTALSEPGPGVDHQDGLEAEAVKTNSPEQASINHKVCAMAADVSSRFLRGSFMAYCP